VKKSQLGNNLCIAIASMGTFLVIGGPILLCLGAAVVFSSCNSEPPKPEEVTLSKVVNNPGIKNGHCPFTGEIIRIEDVIGAKEVEGGSGLVMVLVQPDPPSLPDTYVAAVAHQNDSFSVGDRVDVCGIEILQEYRHGSKFQTLFTARKLPGSSYKSSDALSLELCQEELKECNEHVSTLVKTMESSKEAE